MTAIPIPVSTDCASCGMPLRDDVDARAGLDRSCRTSLDYRKISALSEPDRIEANTLIHAIAQNRLRGDELRKAIFRIYELGFPDMAKRIERRVGKATREGVEETVLPVLPEPPVPNAPQVEFHLDIPSPVETIRPLPFEPTQGQGAALTAIDTMMRKRGHAITIVVGYAGVGKTALILFVAHRHGVPTCIAPTGKAALRIREATGIEATTIHRLIYHAVEDPKTGLTSYKRRTPDEIEMMLPRSRLLVLDESSMVGPDVWRDVIAVAQQHDLKLLCIGDGFQLPPVQPKNSPPFSILTSAFAQQLGAERVELTEVLRQAQGSPIIRASMRLRQGEGIQAFHEIKKIERDQIATVCLAVHQQGGITICHKNVTRFKINTGLRQMLGIYDEMPRPGEPLLCLKNTYEAGLVNGETFQFPGWSIAPEQPEAVTDRWNPGKTELAHFGAIKINGKNNAVLAVEELHGRMELSMKAISTVAAKWARRENLYCGDAVAPHVAANFGYSFTGHKSQGSGWPYVFIIMEPSIRLNEEDGRRWAYTTLTRAEQMAAVHFGGF